MFEHTTLERGLLIFSNSAATPPARPGEASAFGFERLAMALKSTARGASRAGGVDLSPLSRYNPPMKQEQFLTQERRDFWKNKNVFVTGGFGLLGSSIVEFLTELGANVTVLRLEHVPSSRLYEIPKFNKVTVVDGNIEDYDTIYRIINSHESEIVFHAAAQPIAPIANRAPVPTFRTNIMGTWNVLEACRLSPTVKRVLVASSDKAYGPQPVLPYTEDAPLRGNHPYDVSKSCTDLLAYTYFNTYKLPVCVTRCGNLYGPGDLNFSRVIPETIKHIMHNEVPLIRSDGQFVRDYFFVKDAANAYITLAENMHRPEIVGEAFNFSTGNRFTVIDIVKRVTEAMGSNLEPKILNEAKAEIHEQTLSSAKAQRLLNWSPAYTVEEGLAETVTWYRQKLSGEKA